MSNPFKKIVNSSMKLAKKLAMNHMSDEKYISYYFKAKMGYRLNLENPKTFSEKLQWLKLYDRKPEYTQMVDKYGAKRYVAERIGEEHIIPTLGVWDSFDEIDFDKLPERFVLKCTHDSGGLVVCTDKKALDKNGARKKINRSLKTDFYRCAREWPYKNVKPRIIAEEYLEDGSGKGLMDYKFYCFGGEPKFLYISKGLDDHSTASISFVNLDWTFAPYERVDYKPFDKLPPKPEQLNEMIEICRKLSAGHSFLRVDLYQICGKIYFSELTFYPAGGFMPFKNPDHDSEIGTMLNLPEGSVCDE